MAAKLVCRPPRAYNAYRAGQESLFYEVFVAKSEPIELEAVVTLALPNAMFKLRLDNSDREILGIVSGKMRKHFIRILPGDRVKVELSPYDLTKGTSSSGRSNLPAEESCPRRYTKEHEAEEGQE